MTHRILIVGGGFAGITAAQKLARKGLKETELILLTDKPWLEYYGVLYRLLRGGSPAEACIPLAMILPKPVRVVTGRAVSVDPAAKTVKDTAGNTHAYDTLILAPGSEPAYFNIPGMQEYSYGMQSAAQALALHKRVKECVMLMKTADERERGSLGHFVVIGAGPTGVEIAGEILPYARELARKEGVNPALIRVDLIEALDRVLPVLEPGASAKVLRRLESLGVNVRLKTAVASADAHAVQFKDGSYVEESTMIWTAGVQANSLLKNIPGLELDRRGRAAVDEQLRAKGVQNIFILGDCAATPYAGMAQTAVHHGEFAARVIEAQLTGTALPVYRAKVPDYAIPAGPLWAATKYKSLRAYGMFGYALRRAADLHVYSLIMPWQQIPSAFFGFIPLKKYGITVN